MYVKHLQCYVCKKKYSKKDMTYHCPCGGSLDIIYDYAYLKKHMNWKHLRKRPFNHWRYFEFFPFFKKDTIVSLKEGGTPLVRSTVHKDVWFKNETLNPTGAFKDRGTSIEISQALKRKAKRVICASTGNMGASVSAYCARAGIPCTIVVPKVARREKVSQIKHYHASVKQIKGDYTAAEKIAYAMYKKEKAYLVGDYAYRGEGQKSVGFEILDQMKDVDYVFCAIGNGTLLHGLWKGMTEFKKVGLVKKLPKIIGVQVSGCNTVVKAWKAKKKTITPVVPKTTATAIACGDPLDGEQALAALYESKGKGITVSDKEMMLAREQIQKQGLDVEPAGAVPYAGYLKIKSKIKGNVVIVQAGHGLKYLG